jgi:hypothetical protein
MDKFESWQPLFRFLKRFNQSEFVGLVFSIAYLTAVVAIWYWVCFKNSAEVWRNEIVSRNKRFGFNVEWLTPFLVKVGANILLWGSIIGLFLGLLSYINKR